VSKLFKTAGFETRPKRPATAERRVAEMYELYQRGSSRREVGEKFGVSSSRVGQLFSEAGLPTRPPGASKKSEREIDPQTAQEILDCFMRLKNQRLVATELEIAQRTVRSVLNERLSRSQYRALTQNPAKRTYTDDELIAFLREAAHDKTLSMKAYTDFARDRRTADGRRWPTYQTHYKRFGSWRDALIKAGLPANEGSPSLTRRKFDVDRCVEAVRFARDALGTYPTSEEYDQYARKSKGALPSAATIRNRCGTWTDALCMAGL
jgi:transposase